VKEIEGLKSSVENETGQLNNLLVGMAGLQHANEERMGAWNGYLVGQRLEDLFFLFDNLSQNNDERRQSENGGQAKKQRQGE
jgi:hypothetical protein